MTRIDHRKQRGLTKKMAAKQNRGIAARPHSLGLLAFQSSLAAAVKENKLVETQSEWAFRRLREVLPNLMDVIESHCTIRIHKCVFCGVAKTEEVKLQHHPGCLGKQLMKVLGD